MERLSKKCFVASAGMHLLIGLVAFVGPAFTSSTPTIVTDLAILNFEPDILTDQPFSGGGNPDAGRPPTPVPQPPAPQPQPPPQPKPAEPKPLPEPEPPKPQPDPGSFDTGERKSPRKIQVNTDLKTRKNPAATAEKQAQDRRLADARRQVDRILGAADEAMRQGTGRATVIQPGSFGPGGGGPTYANYEAWVWTVFDRAWIAPDSVTVETAIAKVRVVIAPDGTILKAEFISRSGDSQVDASIQRALDRVMATGIGKPFPAGSTDKQRIYILPFDLRVKRGLA